MKNILLIFALLILKSTILVSQNNELSIFDDLIVNSWIGHYQDSEDSNLVHLLKWKYDLNKNVVKAIKIVPEVGYKMETYFYYDYSKNQISFISFINKEMISNGKAELTKNKILLTGNTYYLNGSSDFKITYEVNKNGELIDRYYRKKNDNWVQGHLIQYTKKTINPQDMVLVEGGSFMMGDVFGDGRENELPVHEVKLDSYYAGKYEVTVGEFRKFTSSTGWVTTAEKEKQSKIWIAAIGVINDSLAWWNEPGHYQTDNHPVVLVSWYDAVEYCNWRSRTEGLEQCYIIQQDTTICDFSKNGYRLLTEAEWEYIARSGGKEFKFSWGNGEPYINDKPAANVRDLTLGVASSMKGIQLGYNDGYVYTAPAGSFEPNQIGIYDLGGNVYEWCWDWFDEDYYKSSPIANPKGAKSGEMRSCRDVGFICHEISRRVISRGKGKPNLTFSWGGFRVARSFNQD